MPLLNSVALNFQSNIYIYSGFSAYYVTFKHPENLLNQEMLLTNCSKINWSLISTVICMSPNKVANTLILLLGGFR